MGTVTRLDAREAWQVAPAGPGMVYTVAHLVDPDGWARCGTKRSRGWLSADGQPHRRCLWCPRHAARPV